MDLIGLSPVIIAFAAAITAITGALIAIGKWWNASVIRAATEMQAKATNAALTSERDKLLEENKRLWALLDGLTS